MSVIFSKFETPATIYSQNGGAITTTTESIDSPAGYFRIGFVVLQIPPEDILCQRVVNNDKEAVLRAQNEMFVKSGQARWDVTIRWKALQNDGAADIYQQWEDLQNIIAIFRAAPFVEVESPHLRQIFASKNPDMAGIKLAMALRQLRIDTDPDIVDCLNVTLSMTFFNYFPYTADFGYQDEMGNSVAAYQSAPFRDYINKWKIRNLNCQPKQKGDPTSKDWKSQDPGVMTVTWREYKTVFDGKQPGFSDTTLSNGSPSSPSAPSFGQLSSNGSYDGLFNKYASTFHLDPVLVKAVCRDESNFNPVALNPNAKGVTAASCLQHFNSDSDGGTAFCNGRKHTAIGLMQLDWPTAKKCAQDIGISITPKQLLDPETNIRLGCRCMQSMGIVGLSNVWKYQGKYMSADAVVAYKQKNGVTLLSSDAYVANITKYYNQFSQGQPTQQQITTAQKANADALAAAKQAAQNQGSSTTPATDDSAFYTTLQNMTGQGWILDHRVDTCSFYYKEHAITWASPGNVNTANGLQSGLYPQQLTILLVNNLAQIPLASYQYPTYQHIGPCSSMISVSFLSVGDTAMNSEPQHSDLAELTTMSHVLEEQYLKMRTLFRRTSAIYRTQAVFVENQVLNLCGIHGLMLDQITNETIRDSSNMLSVQMTAGQYENVFEDIGPFRISGISQAYQGVFNNILMGSGSQLDSISNPAEKNLLPNTLAFRQGYQNADLGYIVSALKATCKSSITSGVTNDVLGQMAGSLPTVSMSQADKTALCSIVDSSSNNATAPALMVDTYAPPQSEGYLDGDYPALQTRVKSLEAGAQPTVADVEVLLSFVPDGDPKLGDLKKRLTAQMASNDKVLDNNTKLIYTAAAAPLYSCNIAFAKEARTMEGSPMFSQQFSNAVPAGGPSTDPANQDHGAYRDMGLNPMYFNNQDFNPGMYFTDWSKVYNTLARKNLMDTLQLSQQGQNQLAGTNTISTPPGTAVIERSDKPKIQLSQSTNPISGDINSVMRQTNLAGYTMTEAFPTFKLFFMEENNQNLFYAFDNFYSYAAVQDIEIIWNYKRPATMILRMTNLAHLLNVKLFDDTTAGKREQWYQRFTAPAVASPTSGGETITGQTGFSTTAGKTLSNQPYMVVDMREGHPGDEGQPNKRVPLKYFPLQTGTKIQLRIGSKNDPDQLDVVFGGVVTEVEGNDVITITAQSFLHEMMSVPSDKANHDSWLHFGNAVKSCFTWLPGIHLSRGPAYGGYTIFGQSGDAGTILKSLLKASDAKHFGHWQLNMSQDKLLKGYTWSEVLAAAAESVNATQVASVLRSAGDRCGENVLINDVINYDGTRTGIEGRTYMDQQGGSLLAYLRKFKYYIAPDCSLSLWELLQDVGRRYPEYLLLEKPYGFPYSNEATVVFGHPLDWYYARPELLGDTEAMRAKDPDGNKFQTWWQNTGKNQVMRAIQAFGNMGTIGPSYQYDSNIVAGMGKDEPSFEQGLIQLCYGKMETATSYDPETGQQIEVPTLGTIAGQASNWIGFLGEKIFNSATDRNLRDQFNEIYRSYAATILGPNLSPSDRLQPIRQYHFIDHQSIVHNNMEINGRVYNTVKIGNEDPVYANQNIPAQHRRLLDVTHLINDPQKNVIDQGLVMQCAQSFLREELGKMYRGEIILRGNPKIRPMDILILNDPSTGITGPLEVEQVIHSLNLENGFVTIVKPRACITVNEAASPVFWSALTRSASVAGAMIAGFAVNHTPAFIATSAAAVGLSSLVGMFGAPLVSAILTGLGTTLMTATTATVGALTATAGATAGVAAIAANAAATGAAVAGGWATAGVGVLAASSIVPIVAIVGVCVVAAVIGVLYFTDTNTKLNPLVVSPVLRFGRPWVGGIEGYALNDMLGTAQEKIHQFMDEEIYPTMDLWNQMSSYRNNIDIQQPGPALANPNPGR